MIDPELQALVLNGPAGGLAAFVAAALVVVGGLVALWRSGRTRRRLAAELASLHGRLAVAEARAEAAAVAAAAAAAAPPPPAPPAVDPADIMALTESVRAMTAALARIDRQMGDVRLQIRTFQADLDERLAQMGGEVRTSLSGCETRVVDMVAMALAVRPPSPPAAAGSVAVEGGGRPIRDGESDGGLGNGPVPVPRERVPEPFRRPVPRPMG